MRTILTYLAAGVVSLAACSSPGTGGEVTDVGADAAKADVSLVTDADTAAAGTDVAAMADVAASEVADATAAGEDAVSDVATDAAESPDIPGFFDDAGGDVAIVCGATGGVKGVACAPKAGVSVAFAQVALDLTTPCLTGTTTFHADATADAKGAYQFSNVPPGTGTVTVIKGSFQTQLSVSVVGGKILDLSQAGSDRCFKASGVKIAVIKGDADAIEQLLDDLGFAWDGYESNGATSTGAKLLGDAKKLGGYDVLFIDCSSTLEGIFTSANKANMVANLQAFVAAGHSLYASDWAWQFVEAAFPNAIDFYGDDTSTKKSTTKPDLTAGPRQGPGPTLKEKQAGAGAFVMSGTIVDSGLAAVLGKASTAIYEDLGTWVVMQTAGSGASVEIEAAVKDGANDWGTVPLVVRFPSGKGQVVYTSFHNIAVKDAGAPVDDIHAILTYLVFTL